jgi:hypothetical protein
MLRFRPSFSSVREAVIQVGVMRGALRVLVDVWKEPSFV